MAASNREIAERLQALVDYQAKIGEPSISLAVTVERIRRLPYELEPFLDKHGRLPDEMAVDLRGKKLPKHVRSSVEAYVLEAALYTNLPERYEERRAKRGYYSRGGKRSGRGFRDSPDSMRDLEREGRQDEW